MVSPLFNAKWCIPSGIRRKFPTFMVCSLASSNVSPVPTRKAPFSTVRYSFVGCQCAGTFAPSAHRNRITNCWPSASGLPCTTATSQPLIIGLHFKSALCTTLCVLASFCSCADTTGTIIPAAPRQTTTSRKRRVFIRSSGKALHQTHAAQIELRFSLHQRRTVHPSRDCSAHVSSLAEVGTETTTHDLRLV